jgi:hypothetical protein
MTALVEELVPDDLWAVVEPLLLPPPRPWWGGRVRTIPARNCFAAIIYMAPATPCRYGKGWVGSVDLGGRDGQVEFARGPVHGRC